MSTEDIAIYRIAFVFCVCLVTRARPLYLSIELHPSLKEHYDRD